MSIDPKFIMQISGKDHIKYIGLLDLAHKIGLAKITVSLIQTPTKDNGSEAICKATIESKDGFVCEDIGDANPKNVNSMIGKHLIRMASTRAKARALRDLTNVGMTCVEELDCNSGEQTTPNPAANTSRRASAGDQRSSQSRPADRTQQPASPQNNGNGDGNRNYPAQGAHDVSTPPVGNGQEAGLRRRIVAKLQAVYKNEDKISAALKSIDPTIHTINYLNRMDAPALTSLLGAVDKIFHDWRSKNAN